MTKKKDTAVTSPMSVGRHTGEHIWGYEVYADGTVQLSPGFADRFRRIMDREGGLLAMQESVNRFVADELSRTAKERREWWNDLSADTGLDPSKKLMFDARIGSIRQEPEIVPDDVSEVGESK